MTNQGTSTAQGVYSPLPQSLSDSDSEKELPITKTKPKYSNGCVAHDNMNFNNGYVQPLTEIKNPPPPPMSLKRQFCFVFSIGLCFLTIVVFLWVLPCSDSNTCPIRISNWETQHDSIELTGKINIVKSAFKNTLNLVLFFKRNLNVADSQSGAISILGNNGAIAWYIPQLRNPPKALNCYLIDVNDDDINDCLLLGEMGLEAIDPISGTIFWHAHNHSEGKAMSNLDFPVILQDLNYDNVNEILTVKNREEAESLFVIISGKTGMLMGEVSIGNCEGTVRMVHSNGSTLIYKCMTGNEPSYYKIGLNVLITKIINRSEELTSSTKIVYASGPPLGYLLNGRKLIISNMGGPCPKDCHVGISLVDEKSNENIMSWSYRNSYAFTPASFSFKPTKANLDSLKGHVNGFILKLWQWFDSNAKKRHYNPLKNVTGTASKIQVNSIMERIVLVTFNSTNFHVINASLTEITQLCFSSSKLKMGEELECQPSLENQNDSLLISDLDMDGSHELVSYSSTFVRKDDAEVNWRLVSNMKVIRLEAELPKLYEVTK